jgi:hypothetical protein
MVEQLITSFSTIYEYMHGTVCTVHSIYKDKLCFLCTVDLQYRVPNENKKFKISHTT